MSQYFGEPISCDFKGVDVEMATDYCWIHGSSYIPREYQRHMKCIVDLEGVQSAGKKKFPTLYGDNCPFAVNYCCLSVSRREKNITASLKNQFYGHCSYSFSKVVNSVSFSTFGK